MSVEASTTSQPGDEEPGHGRHSFFRSADSGADTADVDDENTDLNDDGVDADDDNVVRGTVVDDVDNVDDAPTVGRSVWDTDDRAADEPVANVADTDTYADADADADEAQPRFTPAGETADVTEAGTPAFDRSADPTDPTLNETDDVPVVPAQAEAPVTDSPLADTAVTDAAVTDAAVTDAPAGTTAAEVPGSPVPAADALYADGPLLGDPVGLRASWQQAQAGFVDDPQAAVAEAAELVEHTAQTLIGALQQRQRQLRTQWDNNGSGTAGAVELTDTERLRHLMQDYRSLFNQLCQP